MFSALFLFVGGNIVFASISWPTTPDWETTGWSIWTLLSSFTLDSWNVWIGKTPTSKLDVNGTISATNLAWTLSTSAQPNITSLWTITSLTATNIAWTLTTSSQQNITTIWTLSSLEVTWNSTFDTSTLFIDSTNNRVWIGTITPWVDLDVKDSDLSHIRAVISWQTNNPSIYILADEANNKWWLYSTAPKLELWANNSIHMTILNSGYIWIWTTTPNGTLEIKNTTASDTFFRILPATSWNYYSVVVPSAGNRVTHNLSNVPFIDFFHSDLGGQHKMTINEDALDIDFRVEWAGNPNALFIEWNSGNVGIGTPSPSDTLSVNWSISLKEYNNSSPSAASSWYWKIYGRSWTGVDTYTKLLIHGDWLSNSFTDSSPSANVISYNWWATQSSTQSKFWWKSAYFDWSGDYLTLPDSADWNFWTDDFTIDFWIYPTALANYKRLLSTSSIDMTGFLLNFTADGSLHFIIWNGSSWTSASLWWTAWQVTVNTWQHVAIVRNWTSLKLYIDWDYKQSTTYSDSSWDWGNALHIGNWWYNNEYYQWYLDEFRISKGVARWTSNFTPPTTAYISDGLYYKNASGIEYSLVWWWAGWWWWSSLWWQATDDVFYDAWKVWIWTSTPQWALHVIGAMTMPRNEGLVIKNNTTNQNHQVDIDADKLTVFDSNDLWVVLSSINLTADITASGVNGLDTSIEANDTWYYVWLIYNWTTKASLLSTSFSAPIMPTGYTYKKLIGAVRNENTGNFYTFHQVGTKVSRLAVSAVCSNASSFTAVYAISLIPPIANAISGDVWTSVGWGTYGEVWVAATASWLNKQHCAYVRTSSAWISETWSAFSINIVEPNTFYYWLLHWTNSCVKISGFDLNISY